MEDEVDGNKRKGTGTGQNRKKRAKQTKLYVRFGKKKGVMREG